MNSPEAMQELKNYIIVKKEKKELINGIMMYSIITIMILLYFYIFMSIMNPNNSSQICATLLANYEKEASQFTNKDQYVDPNVDNYDIHYLVEQMIYKEFSPTDKKKYLNLPEVLKEKFLTDYLIQKI